MKYKKKLLTIVMLLGLGGLSNLQAQEATTTAGGEASGSGGSASYTIGQVVYTTSTGTNGSVAQGVQQPYEISVVTGIPEATDINLSVSAYPNPTIDYLTVKVENYETANLQYMVFDINGKLLQTIKATGGETQIQTSELVPANYFIKVLDNKKEIKVFKIIKN